MKPGQFTLGIAPPLPPRALALDAGLQWAGCPVILRDTKMAELPTVLLRYLPDSELLLLSWDGSAGILSLKVTKDIGPEEGTLRFFGVSHVNLPPRIGSISGIECGELDDLPDNFIRPGDRSLDSEEIVFLIHGSWGEEFFVIAEQVEYSITGN